MNARRTLIALTVIVTLLASVTSARADATGTWTIKPAADSGRVHFSIQIDDSAGSSDHSSDFDLTSLGLTRAQLATNGPITFRIAREAGVFVCNGAMSNGKGGGTVTFTPSADFAAKMRGFGYDLTARDQVTAAMIDLTTEYTASIAQTGFAHLSFSKLVAFRALGIDVAYAQAMRSAFPREDLSPNDLIALRALHVSTDYVTQLRGAGFTVDRPRDAISLSALHVDIEYVRSLAAAGYSHLTAHQLVELRALNIDAAYIERVRSHGIHNPTVEELIRLKAMNII